MPKAGTVTVSIRPIDARAVARWLQSLPPPLWGVLLLNVPLLSNGVRVSMFDQFQSFAERKRKGGGFGPASIELLREDAEWLAAKVQRGMFGTSNQKFLPAQVVTVCCACAATLAKRAGRPKFGSDGLASAISYQKNNILQSHDPIDPRWMKRLKKRKRQDDALKRVMEGSNGLWINWPSENSP